MVPLRGSGINDPIPPVDVGDTNALPDPLNSDCVAVGSDSRVHCNANYYSNYTFHSPPPPAAVRLRKLHLILTHTLWYHRHRHYHHSLKSSGSFTMVLLAFSLHPLALPSVICVGYATGVLDDDVMMDDAQPINTAAANSNNNRPYAPSIPFILVVVSTSSSSTSSASRSPTSSATNFTLGGSSTPATASVSISNITKL
jgi:hypothetical protein